MAGEPTTACPKCRGTLEQIPMKGTSVDRCLECQGLWFDVGELTLSVEVHRPLSDIESGERTLMPCIRCTGSLLAIIDFPGTEVGVAACPSCKGTFLEKGKLEAIQEALRAITGELGKSPAGARTQEILEEINQAKKASLCPRCKKPFENIVRKAKYVDRCNSCTGFWFSDTGELAAELGVSRKIPLKDGRKTKLPCPRCPKSDLVSVAYPKTQVIIIVCPDCRGVWLDEKRLDELHAVLMAGSS